MSLTQFSSLAGHVAQTSTAAPGYFSPGTYLNPRGLGISITLDYPSGDGLKVLSSTAGGRAQLRGLQEGDVIVNVNGKHMQKPTDLKNLIKNLKGNTLSITYKRNGVRQAPVTISEYKPRGFLGVRCDCVEIGRTRYDKYGNSYTGNGVQIREFKGNNKPAAKVMQVGDIMLSGWRKGEDEYMTRFSSSGALDDFIATTAAGQSVGMIFFRPKDGTMHSVIIPMAKFDAVWNNPGTASRF